MSQHPTYPYFDEDGNVIAHQPPLPFGNDDLLPLTEEEEEDESNDRTSSS